MTRPASRCLSTAGSTTSTATRLRERSAGCIRVEREAHGHLIQPDVRLAEGLRLQVLERQRRAGLRLAAAGAVVVAQMAGGPIPAFARDWPAAARKLSRRRRPAARAIIFAIALLGRIKLGPLARFPLALALRGLLGRPRGALRRKPFHANLPISEHGMSAIAEVMADPLAGDRLARRNALVLAATQALAGGNNTVIMLPITPLHVKRILAIRSTLL